MLPTRISAPQVEPVSILQLKSHLRVTGNEEDDVLALMLASARDMLEKTLSRCLIEQTWRVTLHQWPKDLVLPRSPVIGIEAMRVYDAQGVSVSVPLSKAVPDRSGEPCIVVFDADMPKPGRGLNGIEIDFKAGYGASAESVPVLLRHAVLMLGAFLFENRGDEAASLSLPSDILSLIAPYRIRRLI